MRTLQRDLQAAKAKKAADGIQSEAWSRVIRPQKQGLKQGRRLVCYSGQTQAHAYAYVSISHNVDDMHGHGAGDDFDAPITSRSRGRTSTVGGMLV